LVAATTGTPAVLQLSEAESIQVLEIRDPFQPSESPTRATASSTGQGGRTVAVLGVFSASNGRPRANIRVGSTVYNVGVRDAFAVSYRVVSLSAPCGQFLFGDSSFQLCAGQETNP
jgi:hypothetical protein